MEKETHRHGETDSQTWGNRLKDMEEQTHRHGGTDSQTWGNRLTYMEEETHRHGGRDSQTWGNRLTDMENRLVVARGGGKAEMEWEFWVCSCKLVYIEW